MTLFMNRALIPVTGLILVLLISSFTHAQQPRRQRPERPEPESLKGSYYLGITATNFYHRSIGRNGDTANTPAYGLIFGKYLNDFIKVEFRGGAGHKTDGPAPNLEEVEIEQYASAYMGLYYHWSLFSRVYAQVGMSHVESSARGTDLGKSRTPFSELNEDYLETSLSPSFILGLDTDFVWNSQPLSGSRPPAFRFRHRYTGLAVQHRNPLRFLAAQPLRLKVNILGGNLQRLRNNRKCLGQPFIGNRLGHGSRRRVLAHLNPTVFPLDTHRKFRNIRIVKPVSSLGLVTQTLAQDPTGSCASGCSASGPALRHGPAAWAFHPRFLPASAAGSGIVPG
jgi:hypothetical protein